MINRGTLVRMLRIGLLALVCMLLVGYVTAWVTIDRYGASRAVVWLAADTGDVDRFPSRTIGAGDARVQLPAGEPLDLAAVWPDDDPEGFLDATGTVAFLVVQDGMIRYERYAHGADETELRTSFSVAKSVVAVLIGLAIEDGAIGAVDDPITDYLPELLERDPRFAHITVRHLLTMSSGLRYVERFHPWSDSAKTYYATDLRATALSARIEGRPGEEFLYNNYNLLLEGLILERATGMPVADYLAERLWQPMGAESDATWSLDSEASGFEKMESGLNASARDYARFGMLVANHGRVGDRQVVPAAWLDQATRAADAGGPVDFYALHWWTGTPHGHVFPDGHALAWGNFGQFIYVAPDRKLVIVRLGDDYGTHDWPTRLADLARNL